MGTGAVTNTFLSIRVFFKRKFVIVCEGGFCLCVWVFEHVKEGRLVMFLL